MLSHPELHGNTPLLHGLCRAQPALCLIPHHWLRVSAGERAGNSCSAHTLALKWLRALGSRGWGPKILQRVVQAIAERSPFLPALPKEEGRRSRRCDSP